MLYCWNLLFYHGPLEQKQVFSLAYKISDTKLESKHVIYYIHGLDVNTRKLEGVHIWKHRHGSKIFIVMLQKALDFFLPCWGAQRTVFYFRATAKKNNKNPSLWDEICFSAIKAKKSMHLN